MEKQYDDETYIDALNAIDPASCDYTGWMQLGMIMTDLGMPEVWRDWSRRDSARFKEGDFERKVRSFRGETAVTVGPGTLIRMARETGWEPKSAKRHTALSWDSVIGGKAAKAAVAPDADEPAIVDASLIDGATEVVPLFADGRETDELSAFLDALFEPSDIIGYVLDAIPETDSEGNVIKHKPGSKGVYSRTVSDVKAALAKGRMEDALGTLNADAGAWIRLNPLSGKGVGNNDVTAFRFALLESDDMPQAKFAEIVRKLNLPIAALVDSGNKSLHAVVRIEAADIKQYAERVNLLYSRCERNGIKVDKQNKNPSRLMRMPGAWRSGRRQFLAGLSQGAGDWDEWCEWYEEATDELPDAEPLDLDLNGPRPELPAEIIEGVLRIKSKMFLSGPSKAGKSFALISLCAALANGGTWFGFKCRKSRVMYVNLELSEDECKARFYDVFKSLGLSSTHGVIPWNLRGKGRSLARLEKPMLRRIAKSKAEVVIIDPIYKVMDGNENDARDMSEFTNMLDSIIEAAGVSIVYCHHHSKGFQGGKRSIDRASGSGVFGRDADAILDMIELEVTDDDRWEFAGKAFCAECTMEVQKAGGDSVWNAIPENVRSVPRYALENAEVLVDAPTCARLKESFETMQKAWPSYSAWRISTTLRSFASQRPVNAWFAWPLYVVDEALVSKVEEGAEAVMPTRRSGGKQDGNGKKGKSHRQKVDDAIEYAVNACADDGLEPTSKNVFDRLPKIDGKTVKRETFRSWLKPSNGKSGWVSDTSETEHGQAGIVVRKNG